MPVYEFYCKDCNTIFNFFSPVANTSKKPCCPKCKRKKLERRLSLFAVTGKAKQNDAVDDLPIDETRMEKAMQMLAGEAERINEDDPRQAASVMRKLTDMTGLELGSGMEEALSRMERGEDPETIEAEMGGLLESEDPFLIPGKKTKTNVDKYCPPLKDETLYDL